MLKLILFILLLPIIHELGHQLIAWLLNVKINWKWLGWRLVWKFDNLCQYEYKQVVLVKLAGFVFEFIYAFFLCYYLNSLIIPIIALTHFILYPFYAKKIYADFYVI